MWAVAVARLVCFFFFFACLWCTLLPSVCNMATPGTANDETPNDATPLQTMTTASPFSAEQLSWLQATFGGSASTNAAATAADNASPRPQQGSSTGEGSGSRFMHTVTCNTSRTWWAGAHSHSYMYNIPSGYLAPPSRFIAADSVHSWTDAWASAHLPSYGPDRYLGQSPPAKLWPGQTPGPAPTCQVMARLGQRPPAKSWPGSGLLSFQVQGLTRCRPHSRACSPRPRWGCHSSPQTRQR